MATTILIAQLADAPTLANTCFAVTVLAQTVNEMLVADASGLCVVVHNRGATIAATSIALPLDAEGLRVIIKQTTIVVYPAATKFFKTDTQQLDETTFFQSLCVIRSVPSIASICHITPNGKQCLAADSTGSVSLNMFDSSPPAAGWYYALNVGVQMVKTKEAGSESVRVMASIDLPTNEKKNHSGFLFPVPPNKTPAGDTSKKRVDLPPLQQLDARQAFQTSDTTALFALPQAIVTSISWLNTNATATVPSMKLQKVRFHFLADPFEHVLTIFPYSTCGALDTHTKSFEIQYVKRNIWLKAKSFQSTAFTTVSNIALGEMDLLVTSQSRATSSSLPPVTPSKRPRDDGPDVKTTLSDDNAI